ncbi:hypothetical protein tb265_42550 [Gemmatimonadetes bacterium T265]|nr:hypothetical protein tb265_42550 [Gemmatimonadetes bacterium T265]
MPALLAIALCAAPTHAQRSGLDIAAVQAQLDSARRAFAAAHAARDSAAMARALAPLPTLQVPGNEPFPPERAAAAYIAGWMSMGVTTWTLRPSVVRVASDSTASEEGQWELPEQGVSGPYRARWQRGPDRRWRFTEMRVRAPAPPVAMTRADTMIPMRDGVRLHTVILSPAAPAAPIPILLERTPYGVANWTSDAVNAAHHTLAADGYVFVFQDVRGRYGSEGQFAMARSPRDPAARDGTDESTDSYDTIDWLVRHVPHTNGRVGIFGVSYDGWLTSMALRAPHPALRAASPQAPIGDLWVGDDFFHHGAFRLSYGYEYAVQMESSRESSPVAFDGSGDAYDWYLRLGPLATVNATRLHGRLPTWNAFVAHPNYDAFWQARGGLAVRARGHDGGRAHARRRRLVGPGGPIRAGRHLSHARARQHGPRQHGPRRPPRRGAVEPRRVGLRRRTATRGRGVRQRDRDVLPRLGRGAVVSVPPQGPRAVRAPPGARLPVGDEPLDALRRMATSRRGGHAPGGARPLPARGRPPDVRRATRVP